MPILSGVALVEARKKNGWTQLELSEATMPQINISTISRIERGKSTRVRERTLKELARVLGVSPEELLPKRKAEREVMKLRVDTAARNALALVAQRYQVSREHIVELAPLLFFIIAEQSLQKRQKHLNELRAAALQLSSSHLPLTDAADRTAWEYEERSIRARDLSGMIVAENVVGEPYSDEENPFALFLTEARARALEYSDGSSDALLVTWNPGIALGPSYHICFKEAAALVGDDDDAVPYILFGEAALHDMPAEIRKASPAERAQWVRDAAEQRP